MLHIPNFTNYYGGITRTLTNLWAVLSWGIIALVTTQKFLIQTWLCQFVHHLLVLWEDLAGPDLPCMMLHCSRGLQVISKVFKVLTHYFHFVQGTQKRKHYDMHFWNQHILIFPAKFLFYSSNTSISEKIFFAWFYLFIYYHIYCSTCLLKN